MAEDMIYINVGESVLRTAGVTIPIVKFDAVFEMDKISEAQIIPAIGEELEGTTESPIKLLSEGAEAELFITINDEEILILSGYITSLSSSDNAGLFNRTTSLMIQISHKIQGLAGSPSTSMAYVGDPQQLATIQNQISNYAVYGTTALGVRDDWDSVSGLLAAADKSGIQFIETAKMLEFMSIHLLKQFGPPGAAQGADDLIQPYEGAKMGNINVSSADLGTRLTRKYREGWSTANNWEALTKCANYVFLNILPYNKGVHLANPLALARKAAIDITPDEYTTWMPGLSGKTVEPVHGVIGVVPVTAGGAGYQISFPPLQGQGGDNLMGKSNRYYHFRQLPDWILPVASAMYNTRVDGKIGIANKAATQKKDVSLDGGTLSSHVETLGTEVLKVIYSQLKMKNLAARVMLPWRTDLMPGTNIKFTSSDSAAVSFIGDELYGMITRTSFSADMTQDHGRLSVSIDIASLRNLSDNENDEMTFAEHPVYDKLWAGTKLNGDLL